jgi:hypothetical protein
MATIDEIFSKIKKLDQKMEVDRLRMDNLFGELNKIVKDNFKKGYYRKKINPFEKRINTFEKVVYRNAEKGTNKIFGHQCICNWSKDNVHGFITDFDCPVHGQLTKGIIEKEEMEKQR